MNDLSTSPDRKDPIAERREFLKTCGRFATVTPPAIALLLSVSSVPKEAFASTIGNSQGDNNNNQ
jgi:hypothetical protein